MGIQIFTDRSLEAHDKAKDERITELQAVISTQIGQIARLKVEHETELQGKIDEKDKRIAALEHAIQDQAERNASQVKQCLDLQAEAERFREQITTLQEKSVTLSNENSKLKKEAREWSEEGERYLAALLAFVRKCATGTNIRTDKKGGQTLVADARALLKQYDSPNDNKVLNE